MELPAAGIISATGITIQTQLPRYRVIDLWTQKRLHDYASNHVTAMRAKLGVAMQYSCDDPRFRPSLAISQGRSAKLGQVFCSWTSALGLASIVLQAIFS
jgi:hypothetical protein